MGSSLSQFKDLFVNADCVPLEELFEKDKAGLALGLFCLAVATFLVEALVVLAVLSCSVRELRLRWRLRGCWCVPRKPTPTELQDIERRQRLRSDPTSTRKYGAEPLDVEDGSTRIAPAAPGLPPPPRSGFTVQSWPRKATSEADAQEVVTAHTRPGRPSPMTMASGRRLIGESGSTPRISPALASMRSGGSSRGRSRAQQFAAEVMGNKNTEPTVIHETWSPTGTEFPFPRQGSSASKSRRAPTAFSESPGSKWTRRK